MKLYKYTLEQLKEAAKTSTSIRQALMKLNVAAYGGNYEVFKKAVDYFSIDISHFTGKGWSKGKKLLHKRDISDYLLNKYPIHSHKLRLRLLEESIFEHKCSNCKLTEWLGNPIPLELDHINGDNKNNNLSNLRLLCPNCHTLTPTYRGKNKKPKFGSGSPC